MTRLQKLRSVKSQVRHFFADESGATAIEYAMIAAGVAGCIIPAVMLLGSDLKTTFYDKLASILP